MNAIKPRNSYQYTSSTTNSNMERATEKRAPVSLPSDLKTVILWIYNVNQNGSANSFKEEMSKFLTHDQQGNVTFKDLDSQTIAGLLKDLGISKEIVLKDLGVRLVLFIVNCNQNGAGNTAAVAYT